MNTLQAIKTRKSIRKFKKDPIPKEMVNEMLTCAMHAPSANDEQPWQFIIIDDKKLLDEITHIHPHAQMCKEAPKAILVCGDKRLEKTEGFWDQDCAAATENLLLAAHDLGVGSVWAGIYPKEDRAKAFQKLFNLPEEVTPFALIALGYPEVIPQQEERFEENRVHYNKW